MTSILGIKTSPGSYPAGIVIGSDRQETYVDLGGKPLFKGEVNKIISGLGWVLACGGTSWNSTDDHYYNRFVRTLSGDKRVGSNPNKPNEIIKKTIENYNLWTEHGKRYKGLQFEEVALLNAYARRLGAPPDEINQFILAVNTPEMGIWEVDEFGNLNSPKEQEFEWLCLGSGSDDIQTYIQDSTIEGKINSEDISIRKAIKIIKGALEKAKRDIYTGYFIDIVVLTDKPEPEHFGESIRQAMNKAYEEEFSKIDTLYERREQEAGELERKVIEG